MSSFTNRPCWVSDCESSDVNVSTSNWFKQMRLRGVTFEGINENEAPNSVSEMFFNQHKIIGIVFSVELKIDCEKQLTRYLCPAILVKVNVSSMPFYVKCVNCGES